MLVGGRFDAHLVDVDAERLCNVDLHFANEGINLRRLRNDCGVDVHEGALLEPDLARGFLQKNFAGRAFPARVGVRKKMSDVFLPERTEDGIANRVHERVRIGMAIETFRVRNFNAAENEFSPGDQLVNIVTDSNMNHAAEGSVGGEGDQVIYRPCLLANRERRDLIGPTLNPINL